ncbi:hypothetical protein M413DRAFT_448876 [Hebeloma cylindrosporum]|uniref:Uncharacterized protein n=1 Tax=Hebeloma cylindrosporum TaxID=76867 RepID=A0A0C3BJ48_HEBCY|nr:hypothetical protein M413DRAFT_448876 [Hebeloma cylindrosporum h7]
MPELPANFRSLYRLFLRTTSAAVLHHPGATKNLRLRWRPLFTETAKVTKEIEGSASDTSPELRDARLAWLKECHTRVDNTLRLLYTASLSRGIPHQLTRNLGYLTGNERKRVISTAFSTMKKWKPQESYPLTPNPLTAKEIKSATSKKNEEAFKRNASGAVAEVVRMAEAAGKLTLGSNDVELNPRWLSERSPRKRRR